MRIFAKIQMSILILCALTPVALAAQEVVPVREYSASFPDTEGNVIEGTVDDIDIRLTNLFWNDERLSLSWQSQNLKPENIALVQYRALRIDGQEMRANADFPSADWVPRAFGLGTTWSSQNPASWRFEAAWSEKGDTLPEAFPYDPSKSYEIEMDFAVLRPEGPLVVVDAELYEPQEPADRQQDFDDLIASIQAHGVEIAPQDAFAPQTWAANGYTVLDKSGCIWSEGSFIEYFEADLTSQDGIHLTETATLTLKCTLLPTVEE